MGIVQDALARIKSAIKGEEVRGAIYDSIKYMDEEMQSSESKFSPSIQGSGLSNEITINDGSDFKLADLVIYGNITQDGTPSKSNYVPMIFAGNELSITITISNGGGNNHTLKVSTPDYLPAILLKDTDTDSGAITVGGKKFLSNEINYGLKKTINRLIRLELTSSLNWKLDSEGKRIYYDPFEDLRTVIGSPIASNYFVRGDWTTAASGTAFLGDGTHDYIGVSKDEFGSVDAFKAWLDEKKGEGHPCYILVPYRVPQEKALSDVDIQNFNTLHTYKPKTVISNNSTAFLKVVYTADTLVYIQQNTVKEIDYANVTNKPQINNFTIEGNVSLDDIGAQPAGDYIETNDFNAVKEDVSENKDAITELQRVKADAIVETASGESLHVDDASDNGLDNLIIYGKATQDGTPSTENPVPINVAGSNGTVNIDFTGANIIPFPYASINTTIDGVYFAKYDDEGRISCTGTSTSTYHALKLVNNLNIKGKITVNGIGEKLKLIFVPLTNGKEDWNHTVTILNGKSNNLDGKYSIYIYFVSVGLTYENEIISPIVSYGSAPLDFAPYTIQTFTVSTPNGLPGIPVESGGNYTDATGKQWISDYVDCERKKTKNVIAVKTSLKVRQKVETPEYGDYFVLSTDAAIGIKDNDSNVYAISNKFLGVNFQDRLTKTDIYRCYIGIYNDLYVRVPVGVSLTEDEMNAMLSDAVFYYVRKTPVETDISAEEIAAYKALHTNKLATNVYSNTDPQVGIEMDYGADTKTYIDRKFAAMTASMLKIESEVK